VTWWPWRRKLAESQEAVRAAEQLRDQAEQQQHRAEELTPRVDAITSSLRKLRADNHFGPMIDAALRGGSE
jgi:hypothetical protein